MLPATLHSLGCQSIARGGRGGGGPHLSSWLLESMSAIEKVEFLGKLSPSKAVRKLDTFSIVCTMLAVLLFSPLGSTICNQSIWAHHSDPLDLRETSTCH